MVCCTVLTKSALHIGIKKPVKKIMQHQRNILCWNVSVWFLDALAKLRRVTIGFVLFVRLSAGNCATSRKVARSIPDGVIGIFHWRNLFGRTMAVGLTQSLMEMSTGGQRLQVFRADNVTTFMCWLSWNLGTSSSWKPQGLSRPIQGLLYLLPV